MSSNWRTVQVFLSSRGVGVFEVEMTLDGKQTRCNCPTFKSRKACRHITFVRNGMRDGHYPIRVHPSARADETSFDPTDPDQFRSFVLRYAKIEVV